MLWAQVNTSVLEITRETLAPFPYLQPAVSALAAVTQLYIHDADIPYVPDFMTTMRLTDLHLRTLPLLEYFAPEVAVAVGPTLRTLTIVDCPKLTRIPEEINRCEMLESVTIGQCKLSSVPEGLFDLSHIRFLRVFQNALTWLPSYWGLVELQELDLSSNALAELPDAVTGCFQLEVLRVSRNHLTALPERLGRLRNLKFLDASGNALLALPESLGNLTRLRSLLLSRNQLKGLPLTVASLTGLQELDLESNKLEQIPEAVHGLFELNTVKLRGNPLFGHRDDSFGRDILDLQLKRILAARQADTLASTLTTS
jgi:Leucine-rich repeat (LRR) protein